MKPLRRKHRQQLAFWKILMSPSIKSSIPLSQYHRVQRSISENVRTEQNTASSQTAISIVEDGSSTLTVHHLEPGVANELEIVHVVDGAYEKSSSTTDNRLQYQYNIDLVNVQPEGYDSSTGFYYYQVLEQKLENGNEEEVSPNYNIVVDSSAEVERENEIGGENSPSELQQQPVICDYGSVSRDTYETLATMESKFPPNNNGDDRSEIWKFGNFISRNF